MKLDDETRIIEAERKVLEAAYAYAWALKDSRRGDNEDDYFRALRELTIVAAGLILAHKRKK